MMAYADQKQNKVVALGSAVLIQAGIGAALLTGLVVTTTTNPKDPPIKIVDVDPAPPPPEPIPEPRPEVLPREAVTPPVNAPIPVVRTVTENPIVTTAEILPPVPPTPPVRIEPAPPITPPAAPPANLSRGLQPRGDVGGWFPQDSYPAAARRAGAEGRVTVSVEVGAAGRVTACRVVASSGNEDLDNATCRLATRNGRFTPALNASGQATPGTLTLRPVRWRLEQ